MGKSVWCLLLASGLAAPFLTDAAHGQDRVEAALTKAGYQPAPERSLVLQHSAASPSSTAPVPTAILPSEGAKLLVKPGEPDILLLPPQQDGGRSRAAFFREFIATFNERTGLPDPARLAAAGLHVVDRTPDGTILLLRVEDPQLTAQTLRTRLAQLFGSAPSSVEPNQVGLLEDAQDRQYDRLLQPWPHRNRGDAAGTLDADIDGNEALSRMTGPQAPGTQLGQPVVMIIDSGLDTYHPALAGALWRNLEEIAGDGIDNDGNGYRDDIHGWNFVANSGVINDPNGHGTFVAGIVAASPTVASGAVKGSAPGAKVMVGQISVPPSLMQTVKAIDYARSEGAAVTSMSITFPVTSPALLKVVLDYEAEGGLAVAAAGNDGKSLRDLPLYPCLIATVICVGASDREDRLASFSNYGASFGPQGQAGVSIAAPGVDIRSTWPGGGYRDEGGTSAATPFVAAALAAAWRLRPAAKNTEIRNRVLQTADRVSALDIDKVEEGRRLNLYQALYAAKPRSEYSVDGYCNELVFDPTSNQRHPRRTNYPFANSGEPGIDGMSFETAYTICSLPQLMAIQGGHLDHFFALRTNLRWSSDTTGAGSRAIGDETSPGGVFNGVFDGGGYTIEGMDQGLRASAGLFMRLGKRAQVTNLRFTGVNVRATSVAAVVTPSLEGGRIFNVQADGIVSAPVAGGLVGSATDGEIASGYFEGRINGTLTSGGIAASLIGPGARIKDSMFSGTVTSTFEAGGLAGRMGHHAVIERSHANILMPRPASGRRTVAGGLVGWMMCRGLIVSSYAEGEMDVAERGGGLVGRITNADLRDSYADMFLNTDQATTGGTIGEIADGLKGDNGLYLCSETSAKPPATTHRNDFFNSFTGGTGNGTPKSPQELRQSATFDGWPERVWDKQHGKLPRLMRLPRTTSTVY